MRMTGFFRTIAVAALMAGTGMVPSWAGADDPVVVELFTSQGCSSCPPADAFFAELAPRDDVIALALHVDYWDYIGWKDSFADPAFTKRQKSYAKAAKSRSIYTPQMIVGGVDHVVGFRPMELFDLIQEQRAKADPVELVIQRSGGKLMVNAVAANRPAKPLILQIVRYTPSATVNIERGENAGRSITYHNIVTSWLPVAEWDGAAPLAMSFDLRGDGPVVAILQETKGRGPGRIVAAARLR